MPLGSDAWERSRVVAGASRAVRNSRLRTALARLGELSARAPAVAERLGATSSVAAALARAAVVAPRAAASSRTRRLAGVLERAARTSFLYRWLTAEPEPAVVRIDLRETVTVRPLFEVLDAAVSVYEVGGPTSRMRATAAAATSRVRAAPIRTASAVVLIATLVELAAATVAGSATVAGLGARIAVLALALAGLRVRYTLAEVLGSRPARLLATVLEPPDPPGRTDDPDGERREPAARDREQGDERRAAPEPDRNPEDGHEPGDGR